MFDSPSGAGRYVKGSVTNGWWFWSLPDGRFEEAVARYEQAVASGDHRWWIAGLADSLMFAGRYRDAEARFAEYLADASELVDCVWRLKQRDLDDVRSLAGDAQDRHPDEAAQLADRVDFDDSTLSMEEAFDLLRRALAADACCGAAHHRRVLLNFREGPDGKPDLSGVIEPAISAAVSQGNDPGLWVNAILMASNGNEPADVLYDLMRTAAEGRPRGHRGRNRGAIEQGAPRTA